MPAESTEELPLLSGMWDGTVKSTGVGPVSAELKTAWGELTQSL